MVVSGSRDNPDTEGNSILPSELRWTDLTLRSPTSDSAPMHAFGRWEDQPHQHLPAARLATSPWQGLLIADEVGLGKTISAIRIIRRLHSIGEVGAVIIACPGSLRSKWKQELHHRGDLESIIVDSGRRLIRIVERLAAGEPRIVIVSHGVLRRSSTLEQLIQSMPEVMLTIIDEAHHCRNPKNRLHDAAQLLTMYSKKNVLMTATPINLREEELWVQLSLLAPDRWPSMDQFLRTMGPTRMLNDVLDGISRPMPNLPRALNHFQALQNTIGFAGDPRLEEAVDLVQNEQAWVEERIDFSRRKLANLIRRLRPLNDLLVRTRRRDLDWHMAERKAITLDITLTAEEWRLYEAARAWARTLIQMRHPEGQVFDWALIVPERMASSCLPAFAKHVMRQLRSQARETMDDTTNIEDDVNLAELEIRMLRRLGNLNELIDAAEALGEIDSKYDAFRTWIENSLLEDSEGGVLLFSHFHATLEHLKNRLCDDGISCEVITGRTRMQDRDLIRERFRNGDFDVLLSSEVGSEGLDQQHCHRLVNYDLPWNPMRIEQRIGRLDRFGQTADEIIILNLAVEGTIDAAILHRLYHRIRLFEDALGMLDPLLGQAMRMVARAELDRPISLQMVNAQDTESEEQDGVLTLLDKREMWLEERANEEREWVGPDPGISALRNSVNRHQLAVSSTDFREWFMHKIGNEAQLYATNEDGIWMLGLERSIVQELAERATNPQRIDQDTVGWRDTITATANRSGPYWFHVIFDRDTARNHPNHIFITPHHPIARLLVETEEQQTLFLRSNRRDSTPDNAAWCICIDWTVENLNKTITRRWLYLDSFGNPLQDDSSEPLELLKQGEIIGGADISNLISPIENALLESEQQRLLPLLDELRDNAEDAWHRRIMREMAQLSEADWVARSEGRLPDARWIRMKNGLISRLQDELANRLLELDRIRENMNAFLDLKVAIQID
ncbi:MAG: SNF2-related protein [Candidatus Thermoplasmatota archaeon]|nr:SNF2-related protein [Candidatus Thermoplasmatota archaeon]